MPQSDPSVYTDQFLKKLEVASSNGLKKEERERAGWRAGEGGEWEGEGKGKGEEEERKRKRRRRGKRRKWKRRKEKREEETGYLTDTQLRHDPTGQEGK